MYYRRNVIDDTVHFFKFIFSVFKVVLIGTFTSKNTQTGDNSLDNAIIISPRQSVPPISIRWLWYAQTGSSCTVPYAFWSSQIINPSFKYLEYFNLMLPMLPQCITHIISAPLFNRAMGQPVRLNTKKQKTNTHFI